MRSEREVNKAMERYADLVLRLCMVHLKNGADAEDIFQTVFLKYALYPKSFESTEHEKAWLIRVTVNACKDLLKSFFRSHTVTMEDLPLRSGSNDRALRGDGGGLVIAEAVPGCDLPALLRGLYRPGDRGDPETEPQYRIYPFAQGQGIAQRDSGR